MRQTRSMIIVLAAAFLCMASTAAHAALTVNNQYLIAINRGYSGEVLPSGYFVFVGAFASSSLPITGVTAQQVLGGTNSATLTAYPSALFPAEYGCGWSYDPVFTGQWQITATDGSETMTVNTHVLDDPRFLPLAQNLAVSTESGQMSPTLSWSGFEAYPGFSGTPYAGADDFKVRVRARLASNGSSVWDSPNMPSSVTSYTIPMGALSAGTAYLLEVMLNHYEYEGSSAGWQLESRSETFLPYGTPPTTTLTVSSPYVYTLNRGGDAHAADYIMDIGAWVNDTGGNSITSVWAYNGSYNYELAKEDFGSIGAFYYKAMAYTGQTGTWQIRATNSAGETVTVYTHNLDKPQQIPLVTGVSFSDQTTSSTVSWTPVPSSAVDGYRIRVTTNGFYVLYQSAWLSSSASSFKIPAGIMSVGTQYVIRIQAYDLDQENGADQLENRSDYHAYFTPASWTPIPGDFSSPADCDVDGKDLAALIANPSGFDLATFAANFGENVCQ